MAEQERFEPPLPFRSRLPTIGPSLISSVKADMCGLFQCLTGSRPLWMIGLIAACIEDGFIFRCVPQSVTVWGSGISEKVVWWVVRQYAKKAAIERLAPHDLRRTCARLCNLAGGELEQIQFLLGHRSVETRVRVDRVWRFAVSTVCEPSNSTSGRSGCGNPRRRSLWKCR